MTAALPLLLPLQKSLLALTSSCSFRAVHRSSSEMLVFPASEACACHCYLDQ